MQIKMGTYKIAFVFRRIVIKIPRIYSVFKVLKVAYVLAVKGTRLDLVKTHLKLTLLHGLIDNWSEFNFYRKNKSCQLLIPTYFSIFGLINIQEYCEPLSMDRGRMWLQLVEMTKGLVWEDCHAFANTENFGIKDGKIKMLDYRGEGAQVVLKKYAEKIFKEFRCNAENKDS